MKPLISVISVNYNGYALTCAMVESLRRHVTSPLEIIVVDAASPEGEGDVVRDFQERHDNIRYYRTPERIGVYPAWNLAIRAASGRFVLPFSVNDRLHPEACARLAARKAICGRGACGVVGRRARGTAGAGTPAAGGAARTGPTWGSTNLARCARRPRRPPGL